MDKLNRKMTSRERILATIEGKPVDRVPVMYWPNCHAAVKLMAQFKPAPDWFWNALGQWMWRKFKNGGEMDAKEIWRGLPILFSLYAVNEYALHLGSDMVELSYGDASYWGGKRPDDIARRIGSSPGLLNKLAEKFNWSFWFEKGRFRTADFTGSVRAIGGIYLDIIETGFKEAKDLAEFTFPDAGHDRHYETLRKFRAKHPDACIYASNFGVQDMPSTQMWNMEKFMMAMIDHPEEIKKFQQNLADHMIGVGLRQIKAGADIIFLYDDYGYTGRTLISMDMWKEFTYPHLKRMIEIYHEAGAKVMLHSCGYQMPFLEHYVEAGLDIIQTFQPKAGNDFARAYAEYGDRLTFNTGIDIQVGEMITPRELRESILESYRIGGRKGHHILGMTHMLQYTMPIENMKALFQTVKEIQAGEHDH